ncbi:MAG TPA: hypothetical protein VM166_14110, partial [Gemmatimonadaceae bacterium]|nr:hypothetical protein [Gemmatimonadaceae bacterium]
MARDRGAMEATLFLAQSGVMHDRTGKALVSLLPPYSAQLHSLSPHRPVTSQTVSGSDNLCTLLAPPPHRQIQE